MFEGKYNFDWEALSLEYDNPEYESCDGCYDGFKSELLTMKFPDGDQFCYCPTCFPKQKDRGKPDFVRDIENLKKDHHAT